MSPTQMYAKATYVECTAEREARELAQHEAMQSDAMNDLAHTEWMHHPLTLKLIKELGYNIEKLQSESLAICNDLTNESQALVINKTRETATLTKVLNYVRTNTKHI